MEKKEMKKIPLKNYFLLGIIIIFTVLAVFYMRSWYFTTKDYYDNNSLILDTISEIRSEEVVNYATDNPNFILYVASGHNKEIKDYEKKFKKFILKNDLRNNVLYLNLENVDVTSFNDSLNEMTSANAKSTLVDKSSAAIYIFQNGKIEKVLNNETDIDKLEVVFVGYGVIEND